MADTGKTIPALPPSPYYAAYLIGIANPQTEEMFYLPLGQLVQALANITPAKSYADIPDMLANTELMTNFFAAVTDSSVDTGSVSWALYLYTGPNTSIGRSNMANYKRVQDASTTGAGTWTYRGEWDLSGNTFPDAPDYTDIKGYNTFVVTEEGDVDFGYGIETVPIGAILLAQVDSPGQAGVNWRQL